MLVKDETTFGTTVHLGCKIGTTPGAAQFQFGTTGRTGCIILSHGCATGRAQGPAAGRTLGQPQAHIGAAGRAGPGRTKLTVGADNLLILQQQIALGTDTLATLRASAKLAAEPGRADRAFEQHQSRRSGKDRGRGATLQIYGLSTLWTGFGCVEDTHLARGAAPHKKDAALWTELSARSDQEATPWTRKGQDQPAAWTGFIVLNALGIQSLVIERMSAPRTIDLATS
jgi:hypothetical protein